MMESDLTAVLKAVNEKVFPDVAPFGTTPPWITYQNIGGTSMQYLDGTAADKRYSTVQINVWAASRLLALTLSRQVEIAVCNFTATPFMAQPMGEPISTFEADVAPMLYGCMQDFSIFSSR